jgi:DNA-binding transcriptional MerR regulator
MTEQKKYKIYYSISEVSKITELEQYVLRYWESEFPQLHPAKNSAGNRIYTLELVNVALEIKRLLRDERLTIQEAQVALSSLKQETVIDFHLDLEPKKRSIVQITENVTRHMIEDFNRNPELLRSLHPRKFEELVAELYRGFGYQVELTKQTRDGGKDIIAMKKAEVNVKYLIECKRPQPGNYVSIASVRELYGVKLDNLATKGILVTTERFSPDALHFFDKHMWELEPRDYYDIKEWIEDYLKRQQHDPSAS